VLCGTLSAEEPNCSEIHAIAGMAGAKSTALLMSWKQKAGISYRAKVVFALRFFEFHPSDQRAASAVLVLIPTNREQDSVWHETGALLCQNESSEDMIVLGKFGVRLPHDLARAVLLVPGKMFDYVSYANTSCGDPDSDYAVQMQVVCRSKHREFMEAVDQLPADAKKWFLSSTFNPGECRALAFPEAD
jgi:hypothetical protein